MKKIHKFFMLVTLLLLTAACGLLSSEDPLASTKWQLETLNGQDRLPGSVVTLEFADQRLSGSAGCNSFGAGYKIKGEEIIIDAIAMTEMACADEGVMGQESTYTQLLGEAKIFSVSDTELVLSNATGDPLLTFSPRQP
jgi:heat shock protein HslJ